MWLLEQVIRAVPVPDGQSHLPAGSFNLGRQADCDLVIAGDRSISRKHATITVGTSTASWPLCVVTDSGSQFGTSLVVKEAEDTRLERKKEIKLDDLTGTTILFGQKSQFRCKCLRWRFCLPEGNSEVLPQSSRLGAIVQSAWTTTCTHLVVEGQTIVASGLVACAVIAKKPMITPDWLSACLNRLSVKDPLPSTSTIAIHHHGQQIYPPEADRNKLFKGQLLVWQQETPKDDALEQAICMAGGINTHLTQPLPSGPDAASMVLVLPDGMTSASAVASPLRVHPWTTPYLLLDAILQASTSSYLKPALEVPAAQDAEEQRVEVADAPTSSGAAEGVANGVATAKRKRRGHVDAADDTPQPAKRARSSTQQPAPDPHPAQLASLGHELSTVDAEQQQLQVLAAPQGQQLQQADAPEATRTEAPVVVDAVIKEDEKTTLVMEDLVRQAPLAVPPSATGRGWSQAGANFKAFRKVPFGTDAVQPFDGVNGHAPVIRAVKVPLEASSYAEKAIDADAFLRNEQQKRKQARAAEDLFGAQIRPQKAAAASGAGTGRATGRGRA